MKKRILSVLLAVLLLLPALPPSVPARAAGKKLLALTFDDGPGPYTDRLLDGLKAKGVRATFFTPGYRVETYPSQVRRILNEGHQLANHAYDHAELTTLGVSAAVGQVATTDFLLNRTVGGNEHYFLRFPYGSGSSSIRANLSCPDIMWSVDTADWMYPDSGYVRDKLISSVYDGAVVLMHDIHPTTVTGVLNAIDTLKAYGYEFVTVRELFRRRGVELKNGTSYSQCKPNGTDAGRAATPTVSIEAAEGGAKVTLTAPTPGTKIYYTLDGSDINYGSRLYTGPFTVAAPCVIRAAAVYHINGDRSEELVYSHTKAPAHVAKASVSEGKLCFSGVPADETVKYSLDGSSPAAGMSYAGPVEIAPGTVVSYLTVGEGKLSTGVSKFYYSPLGNGFADVLPGDWFAEDMDEAASLKLLTGLGRGRYSPNGPLTRAMTVTLLYRLSGEEVSGERENPFEDVDPGAYYADAVEWAYRENVTRGVSRTSFAPDRDVTRQELARFLSLYCQRLFPVFPSEEEPDDDSVLPDMGELFSDWEAVAPWAQDDVTAAYSLGLMRGVSGGIFSPHGTASRGQAATVLCRLRRLVEERTPQ